MKKILLIILIFLGILIFLLLYTNLWSPSWNPFRPAPQIVLAKMALKMKNTKAFYIEGLIQTKENKKGRYHPWRKEEEPEETFSKTDSELKFNFGIDRKAKGDPDFSLGLEGKTHKENKYGWRKEPRIFDSSNSVKFKKVKDNFYLLADVSGEPLPENQWIRIEQDRLGELLVFLITEGRDVGLEIQIPKEKQEELIEIIIKKFIGAKFYKIEKELPDERINGKMAYHYLISLDKREIKKLSSDILSEVAEWLVECMSFSPQTSTEFYFPSEEYFLAPSFYLIELNLALQQGIEDLFEKLQGVDVEIWIGKKDNYLYRIRLKKERDLVDYYEKNQHSLAREDILEADISVLADVHFSKFNELPEITPPSEYINLGEIIQWRQ